VRDASGITCAASTGSSFGPPRTWLDRSALDPAGIELADVDGDGRADACSAGLCALSTSRAFATPVRWSSAPELTASGRVRFGDLNGDGRADACALTDEGVFCAFSNGHSFTAPSLWLDRHATSSELASSDLASFELADINGDGRADLCAVAHGQVLCGLAP
jgi:hypothetical protein